MSDDDNDMITTIMMMMATTMKMKRRKRINLLYGTSTEPGLPATSIHFGSSSQFQQLITEFLLDCLSFKLILKLKKSRWEDF